MRREPDVWRKAYRVDGFAVVEDVLSPATLAALRERLAGVTENLDGLAPHLRAKVFLEREHVKNNPHWYAGLLTPEECGDSVRPVWREVDKSGFGPGETVAVRCPAGSAVFFDTKVLHAAGHNRSEQTRNTLLLEWVGPNVLPTSPERHAYQGLRPRSTDPVFEKQLSMTFPEALARRA